MARNKYIDVVRSVCSDVELYEASGRNGASLAMMLGRNKWDRLWYANASYETFEACSYSLLEQMGYEPLVVSLRSCFVPYPQRRTDWGLLGAPVLAEVFPGVADIRRI